VVGLVYDHESETVWREVGQATYQALNCGDDDLGRLPVITGQRTCLGLWPDFPKGVDRLSDEFVTVDDHQGRGFQRPSQGDKGPGFTRPGWHDPETGRLVEFDGVESGLDSPSLMGP
jgi:hypothetical protein